MTDFEYPFLYRERKHIEKTANYSDIIVVIEVLSNQFCDTKENKDNLHIEIYATKNSNGILEYEGNIGIFGASLIPGQKANPQEEWDKRLPSN